MDYLKDLNEAQREAVEHIDGPLLVLAGAGSGKTRVLTYRLAHILRMRHTRDILAVTFTNKAAGEMLARVERLLGMQSRGMWVLTFHALGNRILRSEMEHLGRPKEFVIFDESDQRGLIRECLKKLNLDSTHWSPQYVRGVIDMAKNSLIDPETFAKEAFDPKKKGAAKVYEMYEKRLIEMAAVDFSDLLSLPLKLMRSNPDVLEKYRRRFRYILVDEYQDTNQAQYQLIKLLVGPEQNVCVVGDEDQSIYRWRGADIRNILSFQTDFPKAGLIKLEKNYRSRAVVLKAAEAVISKNKQRIGKRLEPVRMGGDPIIYYAAFDERDEAEFVADRILELMEGRNGAPDSPEETKERFKPEDIAVFYRTHAQSRAIEDALRARNLNYIVIGGVKFYDRKEVKDAIAYLRLLVNPRDDVSFLRIVNVPPRKIGEATLTQLREYAAKQGVSLLVAAGFRRAGEEERVVKSPLAAAKMKALGKFAGLIESLRDDMNKLDVAEMIDRILKESGYRAMLKEERSIEAIGRLENLDELVRAAEEYEEMAEEPSAEGFLDSVSLFTTLDTAPAEGGALTLMTLHTAKGLEFGAVFLVGMENGIFPHVLSIGEPAEEEEERRLCYVGMTRAKDLLYLTRARVRRLRGQERYNLASPYLTDIPPELMTVYEGSNSSYTAPEVEETDYSAPRVVYDLEETGLRPGQRVRHQHFGLGLVEGFEGSGEKLKVKVFFHDVGHKTLMAKFAGLEPA